MGVELAAAKHYQLTDLKLVDITKFVRKIKGQIEFVGQVRGTSDTIYLKLCEKFNSNLETDLIVQVHHFQFRLPKLNPNPHLSFLWSRMQMSGRSSV